jgi:hypothetical protein
MIRLGIVYLGKESHDLISTRSGRVTKDIEKKVVDLFMGVSIGLQRQVKQANMEEQ